MAEDSLKFGKFKFINWSDGFVSLSRKDLQWMLSPSKCKSVNEIEW